MDRDHASALHDLADLVHAIARRPPPPSKLEPELCTPKEIAGVRFVGRNADLGPG
ncbi:hypothetical protein P2H44_24830 [Albimonas sp. CAU 1670]|uniref:hypothetical protein n=1 Tax=Albimonas sp. CAU 1670 TaxID=3032599 RepID=UPI0023D9A54A|nr:hypothetical protein [Albimonas sp. CAU 1670]MDF2235791.1 hypothetical protein [Albimonas sp. CAU 1670]